MGFNSRTFAMVGAYRASRLVYIDSNVGDPGDLPPLLSFESAQIHPAPSDTASSLLENARGQDQKSALCRHSPRGSHERHESERHV